MKFVFEKVKERLPSKSIIYRTCNLNNTNTLLIKLFECYSYHYRLTLSPDEILNTVACIYSKYINYYSEKFRRYFTDSDEKKDIHLVYGGDFHTTNKNMLILDLLDKVKDVSRSPLFEWLNVNFSTSKPQDSTLRALSILSSQKSYYQYSMTFCCGFPSVELLGTPEDWSFLINTLMLMPTLDDPFLIEWKSRLVWLVTKMISGEEEFWQSGITRVPYGSGGQADYQGWVLILNPFNENMDILTESIEEKDILNLEIDIDLNIDNNGDKFVAKFLGRSVIEFDESFKVESVIEVINESNQSI